MRAACLTLTRALRDECHSVPCHSPVTRRNLGLMRPADLATAVSVRADLASHRSRQSREAAGVTAADIARVVGVSRQSVSAWESGREVPTVPHALAYGRALAALAPKAA